MDHTFYSIMGLLPSSGGLTFYVNLWAIPPVQCIYLHNYTYIHTYIYDMYAQSIYITCICIYIEDIHGPPTVPRAEIVSRTQERAGRCPEPAPGDWREVHGSFVPGILRPLIDLIYQKYKNSGSIVHMLHISSDAGFLSPTVRVD